MSEALGAAEVAVIWRRMLDWTQGELAAGDAYGALGLAIIVGAAFA